MYCVQRSSFASFAVFFLLPMGWPTRLAGTGVSARAIYRLISPTCFVCRSIKIPRGALGISLSPSFATRVDDEIE
jgi:hypothetical protein